MTKINEEINISGSAEELLRLMKLAGADDAKAVDAGDISSHTHAEPETGGCGSSPEMDMGDYIRMVSTEEIEESEDKINNPAYLDILKNLLMRAKSTEEFKDYLNNEMDEDPKFGQWMNYYAKHTPLGKRAINVYFGRNVIGEEEVDGDFQDATTEPDEDYTMDVSASIPAGNDLNRKKDLRAIRVKDPAVTLEDKLRAELKGVLAEKMAALQEHDDAPDWIKMFMPGVARAMMGHPDFRTMSSTQMRLPGTSGNKPGMFYKPDERAMPEPELDNPLARMISKLYAAGEITHDEYEDSMEKIQSYTGNPEDFKWSGHNESTDVCEKCGKESWRTLTDEEIEEGERHGNDSMYDKCWDGYERVPGTTRGAKGSCRKKT